MRDVAKSKIDTTLKKIVENTSKANTPITSSTSLGDPNCPYCGGQGYLRAEVPVGDPRFGKLEICVCRQRNVSQQVRERLYSLSRLDELKGLTFDTFQPRGQIGLGEKQANSLEMAFNQAQHYAQSLNGWLLLRGGYGCGKTHLAASIANFAVEMGVPTLFLTVPDLLDMLRFSYDSDDVTFEERFNEIRNASLLSLDEIDARIRSRLNDPELVTDVRINAPDYRRPNDDTGHPELSSLDLMRNKTFGFFEDRTSEGLQADEIKSLQKALKAAHTFAERPKGWLVFLGGYGSGKTHLAAAIANYQAGLGDPPLFIMVPDLLDHLRATFSPNSSTTFDRRFEEIRTAPLLVLDDLGTQSMTPWVREKLYQLFNYRYNAELPTVITTSDSLDEMDPRIRSRLLDGKICTIYALTVPSYHGTKTKKPKK